MTLHRELAQFIEQHLVAPGSGIRVDDDLPLIDRGVIDSLGLTQLVLFVEERAGVRIGDEEVTPDNFQTVASIAALVERLQEAERRRG